MWVKNTTEPSEYTVEYAAITYKGWYIFLDNPNGGILGVTIKHPKSKYCWSLLTEEKEDDDEYHFQLAKQEIDRRQKQSSITNKKQMQLY